MYKYKTTTEADGFGRWSARVEIVPMPDAGHFDPTGARNAARRAIRREILERMPRGTTKLAPIRLIITKNEETSVGNLRSLTYREANSPEEAERLFLEDLNAYYQSTHSLDIEEVETLWEDDIEECDTNHEWIGEPLYCSACGVDKGNERNTNDNTRQAEA